jgi:acyl carrier protein
MDNTTVPVATIAERVMQIVAEEAEQPREAVDRDTHVGGEMFDSLGLVELIMALEDEFEISIPDDESAKIQTVGQLVDAIEQRLRMPHTPTTITDGPASPSQ